MPTREEAIKTIKDNLQHRTGKTWSVTGGTGTAYGWIRIDAPPKRRNFNWDGTQSITVDSPKARPGAGYMSLEDRQDLAVALGFKDQYGTGVHAQGISIPASSDYRNEYIDRSAGRQPEKVAKPYWD